MSFFHGVETVEVNDGAVPIKLVRTSVLNIVGTAPKGAANTLITVNNEREAVEKLGNQLPGFTIPSALKSHFDQGGNRAIVINVFDPSVSSMVTAVVNESVTPIDGVVSLSGAPVGGAPVVKNAGETVTYVENIDYSIDPYGKITVLNNTAIPSGTPILVSFSKFNPAGITDAVVVGTASPATSFKVLDAAISTLGYGPKIMICPKYAESEAVAAELIVRAEKYRAIGILDAPDNTTNAVVIAGRGPSGTLAGFQTSSKRIIFADPHLKAFDPATNTSINKPYSAFLAGVISSNDNYWESPSNKEIQGITGTAKVITAAINDPSTDANQLNEAAITTVFSSFGTGTRTFGNRNASFPSSSAMDSFIAVQRVKDIVHESLELAMLAYLDKPINQALIDAIRQSCQTFINVLIGRGALLPGSVCTYNPANNPAADIAQGKLVYDLTFAAPTPAERITFKSRLDANLLVFAA